MNNLLIQKVDNKTSEVERELRRARSKAKKFFSSWKFKIFPILIGVGLFIGVGFYMFYNVSLWYDGHTVKFQRPVIVRPPVLVEARIISPLAGKPEVKLLATDKERELQAREALIERVYQATRFLETRVGFDGTSGATHKYCQAMGKVNEIGYFPNGDRKFCFEDEADQHNTFTIWLGKRLDEGKTMAEALCLYVTGTVQPMCSRSSAIGL